jgi:DNA repair exonuclease SbcCD ATPase subunit
MTTHQPTLEVCLRNFRSYEINPEDPSGFYTFRFESGVNLLKGGSGVGKSTVFMAISWCLYKKPGTGNTPLYSKGGDKETTVVVSLPGENLVIKRVSPKSLLTVTLHDVVLENEEAQHFINRRFGKEHVWRTCNYVSQGSINHLMSGELSDAQRWDVLYTLAFEGGGQDEGNVSIDALKGKLRGELDEADRKLKSALENITAMRQSNKNVQVAIEDTAKALDELEHKDHPAVNVSEEVFNTLYYSMKAVEGVPVNQEDIDLLKTAVGELLIDTEQLERIKTTLEGEIKASEEERDRKEGSLRMILKELQDKRSTLLVKHEGVSKEYRGAESLLNVVDRLTNLHPKISDRLRNQPEKVDRLQRLVEQLIWLGERKWEVIIPSNALESLLEWRKVVEAKDLERALEEETRRLFSLEPKLRADGYLTEETSGEWSGMILTLQKSMDKGVSRHETTCPCCSEGIVIRHSDGGGILSITPVEGGNAQSMEKLKTLRLFDKELLKVARRRDELFHQLSSLRKTIQEGLSVEEALTLKDIDGLLRDVKTWNEVPEGLRKFSSEIMGELKTKIPRRDLEELRELSHFKDEDPDKLKEVMDGYLNETETLTSSIQVVKNDLEVIDDQCRRDTRDKITTLRSTMTALIGKRTEISKCEASLRELESKRKWWKNLELIGVKTKEELKGLHLVRVNKAALLSKKEGLKVRYEEDSDTLRVAEGNLQGMMNRRDLLSGLQSDLETVESSVLQECVDRVSHHTNQFLENAFENPVVVNLVTERENKNGKSKKHTVGITVRSGKPGAINLVERSLDGFSGGETDRISLGFSNAITTFSSFPLLMLDECISSLDTEMKDKVIRALRQQAKVTNKTIVLVCHDAVDGLFDHVCEVI